MVRGSWKEVLPRDPRVRDPSLEDGTGPEEVGGFVEVEEVDEVDVEEGPSEPLPLNLDRVPVPFEIIGG